MLQGNSLLAFAIGSAFATAAGDSLKASQYSTQNKYFVRLLLHLSIIVIPMNVYMLWEHTAFDTLFYYDASINGLYPAMNCFGGIVAGILGFMVARKLVVWGREMAAQSLWTGAFSLFFAIASSHYDRLTYAGGIKNYYEGKSYDIREYLVSELFITWIVKFILTMAPVQYAQMYWPREEGLLTNARKWSIVRHCFRSLTLQGLLLGVSMSVLTVAKITPEAWGWDRVLAVVVGQVVMGLVLLVPMCFMSTKYTVTKKMDIIRKSKQMYKPLRRRRQPRSENGPTISLENGINDESWDENSELGVQEPAEPIVMNGNAHYMNSNAKEE